MFKALIQRYNRWANEKDKWFEGTKYAGQTLSEYERLMLCQNHTCPDCNVAQNLYFQSNMEAGGLNCACGNCGAEFYVRSASGKRIRNKGEISPLRLKNIFRFTDDMVKAIQERNRFVYGMMQKYNKG